MAIFKKHHISHPSHLVDMLEIMPQAASKNCFRLVVLGSSKTGKTSLVSRFLDGSFEENYTPTIEKFYRKIFRIKGQIYQMDVLDMGGHQPFPATRRLAYLTGDLFLLVFGMDDEESWKEALRLREEVLESKASVKCHVVAGQKRGVPELSKLPIVFAGNKSDKTFSKNLSIAKIEETIRQFSCCVFVETSAKRSLNLNKLFFKLFFLANVPLEMTPELHHNIPMENIGLGLLAKEAMVGASLIYFFGSNSKKEEFDGPSTNGVQSFPLGSDEEAPFTSKRKDDAKGILSSLKDMITSEEIEELAEKCGRKSQNRSKLGRTESLLLNLPIQPNILFGIRLSDAYGFLVPNVQRPSVHSDIFGLVPKSGAAKNRAMQSFFSLQNFNRNMVHCSLQ